MKRAFAFLAAAVFAGASWARATEPGDGGTMLLRDAVARGLVDGRGETPNGYADVVVSLRNRTNGALEVDVCAALLEPRGRTVQRLGLGPPVTPTPGKDGPAPHGRGRVVVRLGPRDHADIHLGSV